MDDFKLINGIGPAIERRLHEVGVTTFAQLAALSPDGLATLVEGAGGLMSPILLTAMLASASLSHGAKPLRS